MAEVDEYKRRLTELADAVAQEQEADVLLYAGPIEYPRDEKVIDLCGGRSRRDRVILVLSTLGGDADAAYRIGRCLQRNYKRTAVLVDGICKSAGTLLALASDELVLSDYAELGPLDVQLLKDDDVAGRRSGLTPSQALVSLAGLTLNTFREHFLSLRFDVQLTTKMSAQVASEMAVGVFKEIYGQMDPMRLGEIDRAMKIALAYGERLTQGRANAKEDTLGMLLAAYPSHEFVIDREEAQELFNCVRCPTDAEVELLGHLGKITRYPPGHQATIAFVCSEPTMEEDADAPGEDGGKEARDGRGDAPDGGAASAGADPPGDGPVRANAEGKPASRRKGAGNGSRRSDDRGT